MLICGQEEKAADINAVIAGGASSILRTIHMTLAYWGFIMMSFHLGFHIRAISAKLKNRMNKAVRTFFTVLFLLIAIYGVYAFIKRGIGDYLLMKVLFAFFDFGESRVRFLLDYAAVMVLATEMAGRFFIDTCRQLPMQRCLHTSHRCCRALFAELLRISW